MTDENGEFIITAKNPFDMMTVKVSARLYADKNFSRLDSGATRHELAMTEGAALTGRVLLDDKPLAGVTVGVSAVDRQSGSYLGHFEIGTGTDGHFEFVNLPPNADFNLYTLMSTMKELGSISPRQIHTGKDGETIDAGDLAVVPGHRLAGRVVLSDDQPVPPKTRLLIGREDAWDSTQVTLDPDGNFEVAGIPPGIISVSVRARGYHVSARNLSIDMMNPFRLIGRVDRDITGLVFMLDKGPEERPDYRHIDPEYNQIRNRTLRGAEGAPDHSRDWTVSGRVLDSKTKEPIQKFRVTPGQSDNFNRTGWSSMRAVDGGNGVYKVYISKRVAQPLLKAEAEGYLPGGMEILPQDATNADVVLKKGTGPAGTVTSADGDPILGATVVLLGDDRNEAGLESSGELTVYGNEGAAHKTDIIGNFAFKPVWGMKSLAAASSNGFGVVSLASFATNSKIVLEPYGKITGTLQRTSGPGTNETLDLMFAGVDAPAINLSRQAETGAKGHFTFDRVPSGHLQISSRKMLNGGRFHSWTTEPLQEVDVKPGQTLDVNITAADRAAADTVTVNASQPPEPKAIPGVEVKGVVLLPNGKPASADVALQVEGKYLGLGKGAFNGNGGNDGLMASSAADGSFTLPMYEGAQSVIALNEEGYAQVSLQQLKASPRVTLQKWGRIEGMLRVGRHLGTNEQVVLNAAQTRWPGMNMHRKGRQTNDLAATNSASEVLQPPYFDFNAFLARTDAQGRFVITFVPPGEVTLARLVSAGQNSWTHSPLATVTVKAGETVVTNVGGTGRTVVGKIKFAESPGPGFANAFVQIVSPFSKFIRKAAELKTDEERDALYQSAEFQAATKERRYFSAALQPDGSFSAEDVLPGKYEINFQQRAMIQNGTTHTMFTAPEERTVPAAKDENDDSTVDLGEIVLEKTTMPIPKVAKSER